MRTRDVNVASLAEETGLTAQTIHGILTGDQKFVRELTMTTLTNWLTSKDITIAGIANSLTINGTDYVPATAVKTEADITAVVTKAVHELYAPAE